MIDFQAINVSERCEEVFELHKKHLKIEEGLSIMLSYHGFFSQDLVNGFTENIEEILVSSAEKKQLIKRIFSILIEGLQNIRIHGEADDSGKHYGSLIIARDDSRYVILFGNLIKSESKEALEHRIAFLNKLDGEQIKEHFLSVLSNGIISPKGNAGLGFITTRLKSQSKLNAKFYPVSDRFCFFTVRINMFKER